MKHAGDLLQLLHRLDGKSYGAYHDLEGARYVFGNPSQLEDFSLIVLRAQNDPFAPPSRCCVRVDISRSGFPQSCFSDGPRGVRCRAFRDYLARQFAISSKNVGADKRFEEGGWGGNKGGELLIDVPGQNVLERTSVIVDSEDGKWFIEVRFTVALPARGRSIQGRWAGEILTEVLPNIVYNSLFLESYGDGGSALSAHIDSVEDQAFLRAQLKKKGLVAFVGNGSILPRRSGASDLPMDGSAAVAFQSPPSMEVEMDTPRGAKVRGMGIPCGITLIVGGGFHGKSTLLEALQAGVFDKAGGDGRERVVTDPMAIKIRAEDGRAVSSVDISPFISQLPYGKDTTCFSSSDASGSTSQAAAIIEALEAGASTLLIDEDTTATNFMIRDDKMQALVSGNKEPIKPFISRVRSLKEKNVSTILVCGGSGDYFHVADTVIMLDSYVPSECTARAREICASHPGGSTAIDTNFVFPSPSRRCPGGSGLQDQSKIVASKTSIRFGDLDELDLSYVEQIVEYSQVRGIGEILVKMAQSGQMGGSTSISEILREVESAVERGGLDAVSTKPEWRVGNIALPRSLEIAAALSRLRSLVVPRVVKPGE